MIYKILIILCIGYVDVAINLFEFHKNKKFLKNYDDELVKLKNLVSENKKLIRPIGQDSKIFIEQNLYYYKNSVSNNYYYNSENSLLAIDGVIQNFPFFYIKMIAAKRDEFIIGVEKVISSINATIGEIDSNTKKCYWRFTPLYIFYNIIKFFFRILDCIIPYEINDKLKKGLGFFSSILGIPSVIWKFLPQDIREKLLLKVNQILFN